MSDFLLELLSEEIPARMQAKARADLARLFSAKLQEAGLTASGIVTYSTPRRLALIASDIPDETQAVSEELKGPPQGAPDQAVDGFCRKNGLTRDQLEVREVKGRTTYFAVINTPGRATSDVLAQIIPAIIRAFPWPKSQRWGAASISTESLKWVRPLQGIIALLGSNIVECDVDGIASGRETVGHRFHFAGETITINSAADYVASLEGGHVLVDHERRANIIREGAAKAAADAGLVLVEDEGLVIENAGLTEWPVPLLGRYDPAFLDVPEEVIQLTARVNQKYFICRYPASNAAKTFSPEPVEGHLSDADQAEKHASTSAALTDGIEGGGLAPAFICTANIDAHDGGAAVIAGNEKVLAARLADAKFFWELDQKTKLKQHATKLSNIVFHEKLGTVADKVERVAKLARWLCEEGIINSRHAERVSASPASEAETLKHVQGDEEERVALADMAEKAARLCKADLVTEMVGEFPELQGLMGGYYAEKEGLDPQIAAAIRDHYKPVGQGDDVPTAPVTVAVSLADKLDTLVGFFSEMMEPTGSKDPFALRRAALGVIRQILKANQALDLKEVLFESRSFYVQQYAEKEFDSLFTQIKQGHESAIDHLAEMEVLDEDDHPHLFDILERSEEISEEKKIDNDRIARIASAYVSRLTHVEHQGSSMIINNLTDFFADRLKVQQREAGVRHDLIDAVFALGGEDDLVRLLARVKALQAFVETEDGSNLLAGYKRAANILKKEAPSSNARHAELVSGYSSGSQEMLKHVQHDEVDGAGEVDGESKAFSYVPEPAEAALVAALATAKPAVASAVAEERFADAMSALAVLRAPIDEFFNDVTVNDPDEEKRSARLALLQEIRDAVHSVADFSKIEG